MKSDSKFDLLQEVWTIWKYVQGWRVTSDIPHYVGKIIYSSMNGPVVLIEMRHSASEQYYESDCFATRAEAEQECLQRNIKKP